VSNTSAVPALIDALVAQCTAALPSVIVADGVTVTDDDPGNWLMIGVDDPNADVATTATGQIAWADSNGTALDEMGDLTCLALSWNGDANPKAARDAAYATCAAVNGLLRTVPALGVPVLLWARFGATQTLTQAQSGDGALALVVFTIHFRARI
jgi:hypothetical protein